MAETAKLIYDGKEFDFPVLSGTEHEKALDISKLRDQTGLVTMDIGMKNTGVTESSITFLDGEEGILRYRGYPIEQLAERSTFLEVAYLLIYGELPTQTQFDAFSGKVSMHTLVHEDTKRMLEALPHEAHPMAMLASTVCAMSAYYPSALDPNASWEEKELAMIRQIAKFPTLVAMTYKHRAGHPYIFPNNKLSYVKNFANMMFALPTDEYEPDPTVIDALEKLLILHADHEQNCSTSTVRMVGSSQASLYASISAGICALWGPLHGGANQEVIEMLQTIVADGGNVRKYVDKAKDKNDNFRLMGFGHRVYKNFDPRATIIKKACDQVLGKLGIHEPMLDVAKQLEEVALNDPYFVERRLYPNVDFYSGIIYRAIGIPTEMFTVMFALGRLPGWIAQWKELLEHKQPISRPRQIYTGATVRDYVPMTLRN